MKWKQRYSVLSVVTITYLFCYVDRVIISATIPYMADEFHLNPLAMGGVMSAFFLSYSLFQFPGGLLADKFGSRLMMTVGLVWWSVFTFATGLVSSLGILIAIRVLFGIGEALFPAAATKAISAWFPAKEKGFAYSIYNSIWKLGVALGPLFVGFMVAYWGWRSAFYAMLIPGMILAPIIWFYLKDSPAQSKSISAEELRELAISDAAPSVQAEKVGLGAVLKNRVVWCLTFYLFAANIGGFGLMTWLPTYLVKGRGFSPIEMAIGTSIPFFLGWIGMLLGGYISDRFFRENRKIPVIILCPIGAFFLAFVSGAPTAMMCVTFQTLAMFITSTAGGSFWALVINSLPAKIVGASYGVIGTGGQLAGFLAPLIIGYLVNTTGNFNAAFEFLVAAYVAAGLATIPIKQNKLQ
ncbi:MAG: MFS transporter [Negativicutes bacterium]|nr:MFS transporter [Negativicutes bacterium]